MTEAMKAKRESLKILSNLVKQMMKQDPHIQSINEGLAYMYYQQGHVQLKSYRQRKEDGYQVKRGSNALLMWGEPKQYHGKKDGGAPTPPTSALQAGGTVAADDPDDTFFPLAYVFSNLQVEPANTAEAR